MSMMVIFQVRYITFENVFCLFTCIGSCIMSCVRLVSSSVVKYSYVSTKLGKMSQDGSNILQITGFGMLVSIFLLKLFVLPLYISTMKFKLLFHWSSFLSINITLYSRNFVLTIQDPFMYHYFSELDKLKII